MEKCTPLSEFKQTTPSLIQFRALCSLPNFRLVPSQNFWEAPILVNNGDEVQMKPRINSMRLGVVCLNSPNTAERANLMGPIESVQTQGFGLVQST